MMEIRDEDGNCIAGSEEMQVEVDVNLFNTVTSESGPLSPSTSTSSSGTFISFGRSRSKVWNEFVVAADGKKVVCRLCGDSLSYSHSHSTSSMLKHLKRKHEMDLYPSTEDDDKTPLGTRAMETPKKNNKVKRVTTFTNQSSVEPEQAIQHDPLVFTEQCVRMKWADSSTVFKGAFARLYAEESYTDVTLVAEKIFFKAHRVVLSAASDYFDQIFKMTPSGQHPVIFLKDIKAMDLRLLLEFVYKGEVSLPPRLVDELVRVGTEMKIRGLSEFQWNEAFKNDVIHYQQAGNNVSLQVMSPQSQNRQEQDQHIVLPEQQTPTSPVMTPTPAGSISIPAALLNAFLSNSNTRNNNTSSVTAHTPVSSSLGIGSASVLNKVVSPARNFVMQTLKQSPGVVTHPIGKSKSRTTLQHSAMGSSTPLPNSLPRTMTTRPIPATPIPSQMTPMIIPGSTLAACTSSSAPSPKRLRVSRTNLGSTRFNLGSGATDSPGMTSDGRTMLMMTNNGEAVLTSSEGTLTVMSHSESSIQSLPTDPKSEDSPADISSHNQHLDTQPITLLSHHLGGTNADLEDVVYSITTSVTGPNGEVILQNPDDGEVAGTETIVVYTADDDSLHQISCNNEDKKHIV